MRIISEGMYAHYCTVSPHSHYAHPDTHPDTHTMQSASYLDGVSLLDELANILESSGVVPGVVPLSGVARRLAAQGETDKTRERLRDVLAAQVGHRIPTFAFVPLYISLNSPASSLSPLLPLIMTLILILT